MDCARRTRPIVLIVVAIFCMGAAVAVPFNYSRSGKDWPAVQCLTGKAQSPINIVTTAACFKSGHAFKLNYSTYQEFSVVNTGHVAEVIPHGGAPSKLTTANGTYTLAQFHFHSVAEHAIDGSFGALEAHFVHTNDHVNASYAVVAVIFRIHPHNKHNKFINSFLKYVPMNASSVEVTAPLAPEHLFLKGPGKRLKYWNYQGSLTTPLCTEGIAWFVLSENQYISVSQMTRFLDLVSVVNNGERTNNRLPQPLNGRTVHLYRATI